MRIRTGGETRSVDGRRRNLRGVERWLQILKRTFQMKNNDLDDLGVLRVKSGTHLEAP